MTSVTGPRRRSRTAGVDPSLTAVMSLTVANLVQTAPSQDLGWRIPAIGVTL